ncbi:MAG: hypothetical protein IPP34_09890 [Bacteroidetes bacterium]|nr:hypothetical protein [Bacteroidota bacterium]
MIRHVSVILSIAKTMMFLCVGSSFSQSRKEIKKYGIRSTETVITEFVDGKEVTHTDSFEKYDNDGNVLKKLNTIRMVLLKRNIPASIIRPEKLLKK